MNKKFWSIFFKVLFGFIGLFLVLIGVPILLQHYFGDTVAIVVPIALMITGASAIVAYAYTCN